MPDKNVPVEVVIPPINYFAVIGPAVWRVSYVNLGQKRISLELVAVGVGKDGDMPILKLVATGETITGEQLEALRRERWPMAHEEGRNPANATLGVKNGVMGGIGGFNK